MCVGHDLFATPEGNFRFRLNAVMVDSLKSDVVVLTLAPFPDAHGQSDLPLLAANEHWNLLFDQIANDTEHALHRQRLERLMIGHAVELQLQESTLTLPWSFRANVNSELELGFRASELGYYLFQGDCP